MINAAQHNYYITDGILHRDELTTPIEESLTSTPKVIGPTDKSIVFNFSEAMTSLVVPAGIREIAPNTFCGCKQLTAVTFPDGLEKIGTSAFADTSLKQLDIPASVTDIGENAFLFCGELESLTLHDGLKEIGGGAFFGHKKLKQLSFPASLQEIGELAFCAELQIDFTDYFDMLLAKYADAPTPRTAYGDTMLTDVAFREGITDICKGAFFGCDHLKDVKLPESACSVEASAFAPFNILDVFELLTSDEAVNERKWYITRGVLHCAANITPAEDSVPFDFNEDATELIIPEGVRVIAPSAFYDCENLRSVHISGSVKTVCPEAFSLCFKLEQLQLCEGIERLCDSAFHGTGLKEVILPESMKCVEARAFSLCFHLEHVTAQGRGIDLNRYAFLGATALKELTVPGALSLSEDDFFGCDSLRIVSTD